ncbi:hypothetical protein BSKO_01152 [Bryopsis sp. KO-2023]|nr:hypothetical protein BSKO_01152 [Bryopsis sp. KO-2023]
MHKNGWCVCDGKASFPGNRPARKSKRVKQTIHRRGRSSTGEQKKGQKKAPSNKEWNKTLGTEKFVELQRRGGLPKNRSLGGIDLEIDVDGVSVAPFVDVCLEKLAKLPDEMKSRTRSRSSKAGGYQSMLDAHHIAFSKAINLELQEEMDEMQTRMTTWDRDRFEKTGLALFDLEASSDGLLFRDMVIRLSSCRQKFLPFHTFSSGDSVYLSKRKPGESSLEALVVDYSSRWIRVALPAVMGVDVPGDGWRLDLCAKTITYRRCMEALTEFKNRCPEDGGIGTFRRTLAGVIQRNSSLEKTAALAPRWMRGPAGQANLKAALRETREDLKNVNASQRTAIQRALQSTICLWQGPPGTGKTYTLCSFISVAVRHMAPGSQILVTASSNVAVDNLVAGLVRQKMKVVRLGQPSKAIPEVREATLDARLQKDPVGKKAAALRMELLALSGKKRIELWKKAEELEERAAKKILDQTQVVAATCITAGDARLQGRSFSICVLDEATQATEPESMVGLMNKVESAVFVGDGQQLPPTVKCQEAAALGLNVSLFQRLQSMGLEPHVLDTQYRMHPCIAEFSSKSFYGGKLQSAVSPKDRPPVAGVNWIDAQKPVMFLHVDGEERRNQLFAEVDLSFSYLNPDEATWVVRLASSILAAGDIDSPEQIGIITPYSAQVRHIRQLMKDKRNSKLGDVEVATVDGFQGREKEIILFSTVRSNTRGSVGFLADHRRLNVALTRARRGLVVIGDKETLKTDKTWKSWIAWARKNGLQKGANSY